MSKRVLYISYDGMTDPLGQSQVLPYIIGLSKKGYNFTLISFEKKDRYHQNKKIIERICEEINIKWIPLFYTKFPPIVSTLWDVVKLNKTVNTHHKKQAFNLVHCRSYISSLIGLKLKLNHRVKFIFDMRGFWADERVDGNLWNIKNPIYKLVYNYFKKKEKQFLTHADSVISLTHAGKKEMLTWSIKELDKDNISVIPCAADYDHFKLTTTEKKVDARDKLGINKSDFVLSYIGSLGTWYMLDEMLSFFKELKQDIPNAKFLFFTPEPPAYIKNMAHKIGLNLDDLIITFATRKELPFYASASDYSIFFIKPSYSKMSSSPTKMGELLAMGIPVICNNNVGDVESIVMDIDCGFCLKELTLREYRLVSKQILNPINSTQIREVSKKYYDLDKGISKYFEVYNGVFNTNHNN